LEFGGTFVVMGVFGYVCILHRERYHVTRFGFWYAVVAIVALLLIYAWAWRAAVAERKERRIEEIRAAREQLERDSVLAPEPYDYSKDYGSVFAESGGHQRVPGKFS
jgi:membrane protein implicated in regulation of membrane protease activity